MAITIIRDRKATKAELDKMSYEFGQYIKVVVDIEKGILAGGAGMHYDEEQQLLEYGCKQQNLWGGGIDYSTNEIDYNSMINIRPPENASRDIMSEEVRAKFKKIVEEILL